MIAEKLAAKGVLSLDAPVSGGDIGAKNGTLTIMVGGPAEAVEKVMPVFKAMGKTITHVGDSGAGQVAKAANQIMVAAQMAAMGETADLCTQGRCRPAKGGGGDQSRAAQCWTLDVKPPRLFAGNRAPGFKAHMQLKDMRIVMETAHEYGLSLPSAAGNTRLFEEMIELGMGELDNSAVIGVIEKLAGINLLDEARQSPGWFDD